MKAITVRNIPPQLKHAVEQRARQEGLSLNKTVLQLLAEATGTAPPQRTRHHDLDHLAGTWSHREANGFDTGLADRRRFDDELWE